MSDEDLDLSRPSSSLSSLIVSATIGEGFLLSLRIAAIAVERAPFAQWRW
jgi:hypothetical protein